MLDARTTPDSELLGLWTRHRDAEAFAELVRRYSGITFGACRRILGNDANAEDVVQECFMALAEGRARRTPCAGAWLHRVATNRALNRLRSEIRRAVRENAYAEAHPAKEVTTWDDLQPYIDAAIDALPEHLRRPVVLHFLEAKSHMECAKVLGLPRTTVTSRIATGVEAIRKSLRKQGVIASATILAGLLASASVSAAPPQLVVSLGKLAISGAPKTAAYAILTMTYLKVAIGTVILISLALGVAAIRYQTDFLHSPSTQHVQSSLYEQSPKETAPVPNTQATEKNTPPPFAQAKNAASTSNPPLPAMAQIDGKVLDASGQPIAGLQIDAQGELEFGGGAEVSGDDGRFTFHIPPGPSYFFASHPKSGGPRTDQVELQNIEAGKRYELLLTAYRGSISGRVLDANGSALRDVHVMAAPQKHWRFALPTARTDSAGQFEVEGLFPSDYKFQLQVSEGPWRDAGATISLKRDESITDIRLIYSDTAGLTISGVVNDPQGNPIDHARVSAHQDRIGFEEWTWSNPNGTFEIQSLQEGEFIVRASHKTYTASNALTVNAGADGLVMIMQHNGGVRATVIDAGTRVPLSRFEVREAMHFSDSHPEAVQWRWREVNDPSGKFTLENLKLGEQTITLKAEGYATLKFPATIPEADFANFTIPMQPELPIAGTVVTSEGMPIAGALVFPGPLPHESERNEDELIRTDNQGRFELRGVAPSVDIVSAWYHGLAPGFARVADEQENVVIVLEKGTRITGYVALNGVAIAGASAQIFTKTSNLACRASTGDDGKYVLENVPPQDIALMVSLPTSDPYGGSINQRVSLDPRGESSITFDVNFVDHNTEVDLLVTENGAPRPGLFVTMTQSGKVDFVYTGHTTTDGRVAASGLPPGEWTLRVYQDGAKSEEEAQSTSFTIATGKPVQFEFSL